MVMQAIGNQGFSIVACVAMAYYVKYTTDKNREEVAKLNEQHSEEMLNMVKSIDNNTNALTKLCEKLEKGV